MSSSTSFDYLTYIQVLKKIIGKRSLAEMQRITGINRSTFSRILGGKQPHRPTRDTVEHLALAISDPNLMIELYQATGYSNNTATALSASPLTTPDEAFYYTMTNSVALLSQQKSYQYMPPTQSRVSTYLEFPLERTTISRWLMYYVATFPDPFAIPDSIYTLIGKLACRSQSVPGKVSLVTSSRSTFDALLSISPINLTLPCSAILVEFSSYKVICEHQLPTACNNTTELPFFSETT